MRNHHDVIERMEHDEADRIGRVYNGAARRPDPAEEIAWQTDPDVDCPVIPAGRPFVGKQGFPVAPGVSAESVGARALCLHLVTMPPGGRGHAHLHAGHETAIYVLSGAAESWFGPGLARRAVVRAGDFHYIPAGVPHLPVNLNADQPLVALVARTDPNEQESVALLPELEAEAAMRNCDRSMDRMRAAGLTEPRGADGPKAGRPHWPRRMGEIARTTGGAE
jgi:uncharacterized RmlC-like cupin family protein